MTCFHEFQIYEFFFVPNGRVLPCFKRKYEKKNVEKFIASEFVKTSHEHVKNLFSLIHDGFFSNAFEALSACILTVLVKKISYTYLWRPCLKEKRHLNVN